MANEDWTIDEVKAAVSAYVTMLNKWKAGESFSKAQYNRSLLSGPLATRSKGSIEYRMQNISAVIDEMGLEWLEGYKPARNVGPTVKSLIQKLLNQMMIVGHEPQSDPKALDGSVAKLRKDMKGTDPLLPPKGRKKVDKISVSADLYIRDPKVKAWVLHYANGRCEGCSSEAPFIGRDGFPFLEAHHVIPLSENGPDVIENTVALCPNCHRRVHHSSDYESFRDRLYSKIKRLNRTRGR